MQVEQSMSARLVRACQLSTSRTAPSIPTSPLAAMAATQVASPLMVLVEVAAAVACPAMAGFPAVKVEAAVAVAPEETVGMDSVEVEAVEVAPSSMARTVKSREALADTSAVVAAAAARVTDMVASCPGGGGGGGGQENLGILTPFGGSDGADGHYGGGGGGGGSDSDNSSGSGSGGNGGFGGGGGASGTVRSDFSGSHGGNGGFGGGSGFGVGTDIDLHGEPGNKAPFGGSGNGSCCGGGGGALGGAIFNESGTVFIRNSTFTNNDVDRGEGGVNDAGTDRANKGADAGAAIFSLNGSLIIENTTISGNFATGSDNQAGGGVVVVAFPLVRSVPAKASLFLSNTILSRNGSNDCLLQGTSDPTGGNNVGTIDANGSGNLILNNNGCPGVAVSADPQLAPLALDPRSTIGTPTMALPSGSPAVDAADDSRLPFEGSAGSHTSARPTQ